MLMIIIEVIIKLDLRLDYKILDYKNFMVLNPEKGHFMCTSQKIDNIETLNFNDLAIKNSKEVEILRITLDKQMNFHTHIKNICRKVVRQLSALLRISPYLDQEKKVLFIQVNDEISVLLLPLSLDVLLKAIKQLN